MTQGRALLQLPDPPTAIFAGSDLQAFGVYEAARRARLGSPTTSASSASTTCRWRAGSSPPLTTIRQPLTEMAATADPPGARRGDRRGWSSRRRWWCARAPSHANHDRPRQPGCPRLLPDPSVCRADDGYYLACSSFEYFPASPSTTAATSRTMDAEGNALDRPEPAERSRRRALVGRHLRPHPAPPRRPCSGS